MFSNKGISSFKNLGTFTSLKALNKSNSSSMSGDCPFKRPKRIKKRIKQLNLEKLKNSNSNK